MIRITAACPAALVSDANQLAMALAFSEADALTYTGLNWTDANGNLYAAASFIARPEWVLAAQAPLTRPAWDTTEAIDMVAAARAQVALVFSLTPVAASPTKLTAIGGYDGLAALAMMGLTPIVEDSV